MTLDLVHIIDGLIGLVVMGGGWFVSQQVREIKRIDILLNKTREDYAINRLEEKIDRILEKLK